MNRKKIIQIAVIVLCLGGSFLVIYNGIFKNKVSVLKDPSLTSTTPTDGSGEEKILPFGDKMDFSSLKKYNLKFGVQAYPVLDYDLEVGVDEEQLIRQLVTESEE